MHTSALGELYIDTRHQCPIYIITTLHIISYLLLQTGGGDIWKT
jgi:hypothetical protein